MKRCIFHVPVPMVATVSVIAEDEPGAWQALRAGKGEHASLRAGTTLSGEIELITCIDIAPKRRRTRRARR